MQEQIMIGLIITDLIRVILPLVFKVSKVVKTLKVSKRLDSNQLVESRFCRTDQTRKEKETAWNRYWLILDNLSWLI